MTTVISGDTGVSQVQNNIVSPVKLTQPLTLGTAQNTTSGTSIDFTGIPSWVKRITVMFNGVSTNSTSPIEIRLGTSSGIVSSGYLSHAGFIQGSAVGSNTSASGLLAAVAGDPSNTLYGPLVISKQSGNLWVSSGVTLRVASPNYSSTCSGAISLADNLDRLRITTVNGTDTFDAGSVNILYEG